MKKMNIKDFSINPFTSIGKEWALIVVEDEKEVNAMTIAWGSLGVIWRNNVATVYVRNTRYSKHMLDSAKRFSICFFDESYRSLLNYFGTVSKRDEDKIKTSKLTLDHLDDVPYLKEAKLVITCDTFYQTPLPLENANQEIKNCYHSSDEYHEMYIGKIKGIYQN